nr:TRAP transporter large permease subunit [Thiocapsa imhoffii]
MMLGACHPGTPALSEWMPLLLFLAVILTLMLGYPVALSLGGTALAFALIGGLFGVFEPVFLEALPNRIFGIMTNETLIAVPLFVFMGVMLERSRVAESLLETMAMLFGPLRGGLGLSVTLVGMLLAASTGIVGATVVTMGLLSLPVMMRRNYSPSLAAGTICASGTLGQIIPPSIVLVLLGDVISSAYQQAQLDQGVWSPDTVSVGDLFVGALIPGLMLVAFYMLYIIGVAVLRPAAAPAIPREERALSGVALLVRVLAVLVPPLVLVVAVLGSILAGMATPTEAAAVGALGAMVLAATRGRLNLGILNQVVQQTALMTSMVFLIFIGATIFSLVFRGFGGDDVVSAFLTELPGGVVGAVALVMLVLFLLGFILDFIEITFVVVPIVGPILLAMGLDPIWLGVMIAINLQTSFLTPPFGFSLFYLRGVAPPEIKTSAIYRGVIPFILIQLCVLVILAVWPALVTWLPRTLYGS